MYATEGDAVAAEGQDILALEGALLRPHAGLPQLLQARHVENVGDGRVPLQGARDSLKEKSENAINYPKMLFHFNLDFTQGLRFPFSQSKVELRIDSFVSGPIGQRLFFS